ncbi:hypothetical protein, partial [Streptomyces sp. SID4917]|uniref:hypothetical protein n=1 Tax=Streptomyces sp. SID4917 TaxID=2690269 RepID=UPI001F2F9305
MPAPLPPVQQVPGQSVPGHQVPGHQVPGQQVPGQQVPAGATGAQQPAGRRARRALAPAQERHTERPTAPAESEGARSAFALPPAAADRAPS